MEILLLVIGCSFCVFFITLGISSLIKRDGKFRLYIIGVILSFILAFIGFLKIPINQDNNLSNKNNTAISKTTNSVTTKVAAMDSQAVSSVIKNNPLNVSFINNGLNGAVLIQFSKKNVLIDCGKAENIQYIKDSLKGHSVENLDSIILTTSDDNSIGAASQIIKDYDVKDIRYIDDNLKNSKFFKDIEAAAKANNTVVKKINSTYGIDNAIVTAESISKGFKVDFKFPEDQYDSSIQTMAFVKDSFNNDVDRTLHHSVNTNCDSLGNITVSVSTYHN